MDLGLGTKLVCGLLLVAGLNVINTHGKENVTKPLKIVTILEPPYVMKDPETGKFTGLMIDVLNIAGIPIDHIDTPIHDTYGMEQNPGEFNGMIGDVVSGKYDLAVGPFSIRSKRAQVVTFSQPIIHHGYMSLYKIPKDDNLNIRMDAVATLVKPFSPGLWVIITLTCIVTSIFLYLIRRFSPYEYDVGTPASQRAEEASCGHAIMLVLASLHGRDASGAPRSFSARLLTVIWWFFSLLTVGAYIAGLAVIMFRTNPHIKGLPFESTEELLAQTDVKVLVVKNSGTYNYMAGHHGYAERKFYKYWKANWDTTVVDSMTEALKLLEEGDGKYAVFMDEDLADYLASSEPCDKMVIGEPVGDETLGFVCQKGTSVCDDIDHHILNMQETGQMEKIREKYFWSGCHMSSELYYEGNTYFDTFGGKEPGLLSPDSMTVKRFAAAFIVLAIGTALAFIALLAEIMYSRRKGNIHRQLKSFSRHEDAERIQDHDLTPDA